MLPNVTINYKSYYLHGLAILLLMTLPPIHIFFNLSPVNLSIAFSAWLFSYLAFYAMQIVVAFYAMEGFRLEAIVIAMASFPIYLKALVNVIRGKEQVWKATGNQTQKDNPLNFITPQILIFLFLSFTTIAGVWKTYYTGEFSLSLIWNTINTLIFGSFLMIVARERRAFRATRKKGTAKRSKLIELQRA